MQDNGDSFRGLGFLDSRQDKITLEFIVPAVKKNDNDTNMKKKRGSKQAKDVAETLEVLIAQDKTALRSRKGDTGSVLWRARCVDSWQAREGRRKSSCPGLVSNLHSSC